MTEKSMITIEQLKERFNLTPLPEEGGYFAETYRSSTRIASSALGDHYEGHRCLSTAIYYLLTPYTFSALHMLPTDEIYHFYLGDPVELLELHKTGSGCITVLGPDIEKEMKVQHCVARFNWQGSRLVKGGKWALLGTTMSPGFEFTDYSAGNRLDLVKTYPDYQKMIYELTR
jgi:uncharacterized protein